MSSLQFYVNGIPAPFSSVWVHLKRKGVGQESFRIHIPRDLVKKIFDPYQQKVPVMSWEDYIKEQMRILGTAIVQEWVKEMRIINGENRGRVSWVLTFIEFGEESSQGIVLLGELEGFRRDEAPELKKLR